MDYLELVNVQFAIPIVGVILCVLLIFAFGFRSVGQPSFEAMGEVETKKKKGKELKKNNKTKTTNGNVVVEKVKHDLEKKPTMKKRFAENKSNKQLSVSKSLNQKPAQPIIEEETTIKDGEWQTCLSKKKSRKLREESASNDVEKDTQSTSTKKRKPNEILKKNRDDKIQNNKKKNKSPKDLFENLNEPKPLKTKKVAKKEALREIESNQPNKKIEDKLPTSPPEITNQGKIASNENSHSKSSDDWQEAPKKSKRRTRREQ